MNDSAKALAGHAADSPGNVAGPAPGRYTEHPAGMMAVGHPSEMSHGVEVMHGQQALTPMPAASLATVYGNEGPIASSIQQHQGRAQVQVLDQVAAANPTLAPQLGPRAPQGAAGMESRGGDRIAPTSATEVRGEHPALPPVREYRREPGWLQGPPR